MKRNLFWDMGIIILLAGFLSAILGGGISLTSFTGSKTSEENSTEPDPISITMWSDQAELFLEYPPFVAGHASIFAAHLTDIRNFRPVITGNVEVQMTTRGNQLYPFWPRLPSGEGYSPLPYMPGWKDGQNANLRSSLNSL